MDIVLYTLEQSSHFIITMTSLSVNEGIEDTEMIRNLLKVSCLEVEFASFHVYLTHKFLQILETLTLPSMHVILERLS